MRADVGRGTRETHGGVGRERRHFATKQGLALRWQAAAPETMV